MRGKPSKIVKDYRQKRSNGGQLIPCAAAGGDRRFRQARHERSLGAKAQLEPRRRLEQPVAAPLGNRVPVCDTHRRQPGQRRDLA